MGTDQSKPASAPAPAPQGKPSNQSGPGALGERSHSSVAKGKIQEDEIPYTSYGKNQVPDQGIIVVSSNPFASYNDVEPELLALQKIPFFTPLLKSSSGFNLGDFFSAGKDPSALDVLKPDAILALCQVYQHHMKKISAEVAHDQKLLTTNIKHLESFCTKVTQTMAAKHQQAQYYSEHLKAVPQILQLVEKTNTLASKAIKSLEFLNNMLPVEERLEPISVHIPYSGEYRTSLPKSQEDPGESSDVYVRKEQTPSPVAAPVAAAAESTPTEQEPKQQPQQQEEEENKALEEPPKQDGGESSDARSAGGSTEYSSESSTSRKFRADLIDESERASAAEELVVHTSKPGKKKKKAKKPVEIS